MAKELNDLCEVFNSFEDVVVGVTEVLNGSEQ
jgi:hypothetical protein